MAQDNDIHDHPITVFTACTSITKVLFRRDRVILIKLYMYNTYRYIYTYIICTHIRISHAGMQNQLCMNEK